MESISQTVWLDHQKGDIIIRPRRRMQRVYAVVTDGVFHLADDLAKVMGIIRNISLLSQSMSQTALHPRDERSRKSEGENGR